MTASRIRSQAMHYMKARLEPIVREGALATVHVVQLPTRSQRCEGHRLCCRALRPHHGRQWAPGFASPRSLHRCLHHHPRLDVKACETSVSNCTAVCNSSGLIPCRPLQGDTSSKLPALWLIKAYRSLSRPYKSATLPVQAPV